MPESPTAGPADPAGSSQTPAPGGRTPPALRAVVLAVLVETVLLVAVGVFFLVELVVADASSLATALSIAVLAVALGGFLGLCARALSAGRRWARAPVMTWQLLLLLGVVPSLLGDLWWAAAPLVLLSLVAGGGLLVPSVVAATTTRDEPPVL